MVTYPISLPSDIPVESASMTADTNYGSFESVFTKSVSVQEYAGDRFNVAINFPAMNQEQASKLQGFITSLNGQVGVMYWGDPLKRTPNGVATGSPVVNGTNNANSKILNIKGFTPNTTGILKAGDYIQLGNGLNTFLHMVQEDVDSDVSGNCSVGVFPKLKKQFNDGELIILNDTVGVFRQNNNSVTWNSANVIYTGVSLDLVQAL